ncbi:MAG: hypothetical protein JNL67_14805 [Planctomycetaceae bacterium]|nr:hypothetical protein [Planctomycetaceae bacterium]
MMCGIWRTPRRIKSDRLSEQADAKRWSSGSSHQSVWHTLCLGALAIVCSGGCHALLPTRALLTGQFNNSETADSPSILVDRTGQPLPGEEPSSNSNAEPQQMPPTSIGPSSWSQPRLGESSDSAVASSITPAENPQAVDQLIGQRTSAKAASNLNRPVLTERKDTNSGLNSIQFEDIALTGPNDSSSTQNTSSATFSATTNSTGSTPTQGQSFQVEVVSESTGMRPSEEISPTELAASQSMVQAIHQVTSRGLGRIAGGGSDDTASPALANLLMDQVQQSISGGQIQQASAALQNLESNGEIPAFDLNGNRPVNRPNSFRTNLEATPGAPETAATHQTHLPNDQSSPTVEASSTVIAWRPAIKQAIDSVERTILETSDTQEKQSLEIYLRLLRLMAHDPDQAVRSIESLPKPRQAFWREQIFALSQIIQAPESEQDAMFVNHSRQATKALAHLQNAIDSLKSEATLQLRQVQFCQEIRSFGDYDLARTTLMAPGDPMLIYCEVLNYLATQTNENGGGYYHTNLVPSYMIFDAQQQVVSQKVFSVVRDRCRSRRQDFYLVLQLEVPNLPSGKYHLQVSVEDQEANKIAVSAPLPFQVRN